MDVDPDRIREHAKRVDTLAGIVGESASAGTTTVDTEAFGLMCSPFLSGTVTDNASSLVTAIKAMNETLALTSEGLREMAAQYDLDDDSARARMLTFHLGNGDGLPGDPS